MGRDDGQAAVSCQRGPGFNPSFIILFLKIAVLGKIVQHSADRKRIEWKGKVTLAMLPRPTIDFNKHSSVTKKQRFDYS